MKREIAIPECLTLPEARDRYADLMNVFYDERDAVYRGRDIRECQIGKYCESGAQAAALTAALRMQQPDRTRTKPLKLPLRVPTRS